MCAVGNAMLSLDCCSEFLGRLLELLFSRCGLRIGVESCELLSALHVNSSLVFDLDVDGDSRLGSLGGALLDLIR